MEKECMKSASGIDKLEERKCNMNEESRIWAEDKCSICLDVIKSKCSTDTCEHQFCFLCLHHWSSQHSFCPLCRQTFQIIKYNIRSDNDFDIFLVDNQENAFRQTLLSQLNSLRTELSASRVMTEQQMDRYRRQFESAELRIHRITESIARIDAINNQNNAHIEETINDIRDNYLSGLEDVESIGSTDSIPSLESVELAETEDLDADRTSEIVDETVDRIVGSVSDSIAELIEQIFNEHCNRLESINSTNPLNRSSHLGLAPSTQARESQDLPNVTAHQSIISSAQSLFDSPFIQNEVQRMIDQLFSDTIDHNMPSAESEENENEDKVNDQNEETNGSNRNE